MVIMNILFVIVLFVVLYYLYKLISKFIDKL